MMIFLMLTMAFASQSPKRSRLITEEIRFKSPKRPREIQIIERSSFRPVITELCSQCGKYDAIYNADPCGHSFCYFCPTENIRPCLVCDRDVEDYIHKTAGTPKQRRPSFTENVGIIFCAQFCLCGKSRKI